MRCLSLNLEGRLLLLFDLLIGRVHQLNVNGYILVALPLGTLLGLFAVHRPGLPPRFTLVNYRLDLLTDHFCFLHLVPRSSVSKPVEVLIQVFDSLLLLQAAVLHGRQRGTMFLSSQPHPRVLLDYESHP